MKNRTIQTLVNYLCATAGLTSVAIGVALSVDSNLGTSPISTLPYVMNLYNGISIGTYTAILHAIFILIQFILLGKKFRPARLMQIPAAIVFGALTDLAIWAFSWIHLTTYLPKLLLTLIALLFTSFGISLEVRSHAWMIAGEMTVDAISRVTGIKFRNVKIIFDSSLVVISAVLALVFFHNPLGNGAQTIIREGTLVFAIFTGLLMRLTDPICDRILRHVVE